MHDKGTDSSSWRSSVQTPQKPLVWVQKTEEEFEVDVGITENLSRQKRIAYVKT